MECFWEMNLTIVFLLTNGLSALAAHNGINHLAHFAEAFRLWKFPEKRLAEMWQCRHKSLISSGISANSEISALFERFLPIFQKIIP